MSIFPFYYLQIINRLLNNSEIQTPQGSNKSDQEGQLAAKCIR